MRKIYKEKLIKDEEVLLQKYFQESPIKLIQLKSLAVGMFSNNLTVKQIASSIIKKERTVQRWLTDFKERRLSSIFSGYVANENASKLTREQKEEIKEHLAKTPSECLCHLSSGISQNSKSI